MRRGLILILFLAAIASFGNEGWVKWYKLKNYKRSLIDENRLLAEHNLTLIQEINDLKDPQFLERYIRQEWGLVRENELLFEFPEVQTP